MAVLALVGCSSEEPSAGTAATSTITTDVSTAAESVPTPAPASTSTPTSESTSQSTSESTSTAAPTTTSVEAPPSSAPVATTPGSTIADAVIPEGFEQVAATATAADGTVCELCLWLADDGDRRARGLMQVTDLGGPDGMLFRYPAPTTAAFWMKNTVMPLSIAFFDAAGAYLDAFDMEPCTADPCDTYPTPNDFVYAVEVPQGGLEPLAMTPGSVLIVSDLPCE